MRHPKDYDNLALRPNPIDGGIHVNAMDRHLYNHDKNYRYIRDVLGYPSGFFITALKCADNRPHKREKARTKVAYPSSVTTFKWTTQGARLFAIQGHSLGNEHRDHACYDSVVLTPDMSTIFWHKTHIKNAKLMVLKRDNLVPNKRGYYTANGD